MKEKNYNLQLTAKQVQALYDIMMNEDMANILLGLSPPDTIGRYTNHDYTVCLCEDIFDNLDKCLREVYRNGKL